ncbi:MAG TPA: hypothetical protein VGM90_16275 [Kofleriaceae bacterium]
MVELARKVARIVRALSSRSYATVRRRFFRRGRDETASSGFTDPGTPEVLRLVLGRAERARALGTRWAEDVAFENPALLAGRVVKTVDLSAKNHQHKSAEHAYTAAHP